MTNSQRLAKVRARLLRWIADQAPGTAEGGEQASLESKEGSTGASILRETILIRDEHFCGRHFYTADHHATWFIEEDELKIFCNHGKLVCVLASHEFDEEFDEQPFRSSPNILKLPIQTGKTSSDSQDSTRRAA